MKRIFLTLLVATGLAVVFGFAAQTAHAQSTELTAEQIESIKSNCVTTKSTLGQLHASDALLRVNRGQIYESMVSKLMDPFNSRLSNNRLDSQATSVVSTAYRSTLDSFRSDYKRYEEKLSAAIRIDCSNEPELFYTTIQEARLLRAKVHENVTKLHRSIDDYRAAVGDFQLNFERLSE